MNAAVSGATPVALFAVSLLPYLPAPGFPFVHHDDLNYARAIGVTPAFTSVEGANRFPLTRLSHSLDGADRIDDNFDQGVVNKDECGGKHIPSRYTAVMQTARSLAIPVALFAVSLLLYLPALGFPFVNYDDPDYARAVGVTQAFTSVEGANWFPLTRLSHSLDVALFGAAAGGHHAVSVLLHAVAAVLFYLAFLRLTADRGRSLFIAAVFAIHPMHVESVAWVAERKDVLCGLFWALALLAYAQGRTWLVYGAFAAALMSKPMAVTFPVVLVVLDWRREKGWRLRSRLPLFAMSAAAAVVAFWAQRGGGAVVGVEDLPLGVRVANAVVSYAVYAGKLIWPSNLAVFYPFRPLAVWEVAASVAALAGVTAIAVRRREWLAGWLWYLVTLLPVIGLVQVGLQARADRYTYLPYVGLAMMLAWAVPVRLLAIPCVLWAAVAFHQVGVWRNSLTLFGHAVEVTQENYVAHNNLGVALRDNGEFDAAARHFRAAVEIRPAYADAQNNLGETLLRSGRIDEAEPHIRAALSLEPGLPQAHVNLGTVFSRRGDTASAEREYRQAIDRDPQNPTFVDARYNLGQIYGMTNRPAEAAAEFREVVRLRPADAEAHYNLGIAYAAQERLGDAIDEFRAAIRLRPDYVNAHFNLGVAHASRGDCAAALPEFSEALTLRPDFEEARRNVEACRGVR